MTTATSSNFGTKYSFWLIVIGAIVLRQIPIVSLPLNWLESYFHELSHGLTAWLTGGQIVSIQLFTNGAGLCTSIGGSRFLISFMGYSGAIVWGVLLYLLAKWSYRVSFVVIIALMVLIATSMLLWIRDLTTLVITACFLGLFSLSLNNSIRHKLHYLLQFIGITILLNALHSPLYLIDGQARGDGAALAHLTFVPELVWISVWFTFALAALYWLGKYHR